MADGRWHPLIDGCPPEWASEWGQDRYGIFAGFSVGEVEQRMRWIPPGTFMMGSPEDELGSFNDESPQHSVTITRGFWLADTPVTQALWIAVMGSNPSRFKGDLRPVERVSWDDGQHLCSMLNQRFSAPDFHLPTEAQWEYACRAGTAGATYVGNLESEQHSSVVDAVAWYERNSDRETHPVKKKRPNSSGLYDMLGNVLEWCSDSHRRYDSVTMRDPLGSTQTSDSRVNRGGCWGNDARRVRAASRNASPRDSRTSYHGLRLVRNQPEPTAEAAGQPSGTGLLSPR